MKNYYRLKNLNDNALFSLRQPLMVLGRNAYCEIHIDSGLLSRQHAEIRTEGDQVIIEDLNSTNGTFVNNMRIESATSLMHGDVVSVGHERFMLIAPDKNDGSTVYNYNMSQALEEQEDSDVPVAKTQLQRAFPSPLVWSNPKSYEPLQNSEVEQLEGISQQNVQYDAHLTPALLIVRDGAQRGKVYPLAQDKPRVVQSWQIGRNHLVDVIIEHPTVSNEHAFIKVDENSWWITDNNSTNGVKLNGKRILEAECGHGDVITLGNLELVLKIL